MRILLVEDEEMLGAIIEKGLNKLGYAVDVAFDGEEALFQYGINEYDLMILDLNLPKIDGMDVLRKIRETDYQMKIIILSARSKVSERITGLDEGANDYLIKPFDFAELEARIRCLLRRSFIETPTQISIYGFVLDTNKKTVCYGDAEVELTKKEYSIFEYLLRNKNRVISAEEFVEHIWNNEFDPFSNVLRYHIHTLKKKAWRLLWWGNHKDNPWAGIYGRGGYGMKLIGR